MRKSEKHSMLAAFWLTNSSCFSFIVFYSFLIGISDIKIYVSMKKGDLFMH